MRLYLAFLVVALAGCADERGKALATAVRHCEGPVQMEIQAGGGLMGSDHVRFSCTVNRSIVEGGTR
jgi:hypothetical protein